MFTEALPTTRSRETGRRPGLSTDAADANAPPSGLLLRVLDEVNLGLFLVTVTGAVRYANQTAIRECTAGQPVHYDGQRLRTSSASDFDELSRALAATRAGRRAMLTFRSPLGSISVGVVPVAASRDDSDATALLVLGKRGTCEPLSLQFFAQMHQLTPAESSVVAALCEGLRPAEIAGRGGVALCTIRTQIGSIRQKTRAQSVGQVVSMVECLPPIVPALNHGGTAHFQPRKTAQLAFQGDLA